MFFIWGIKNFHLIDAVPNAIASKILAGYSEHLLRDTTLLCSQHKILPLNDPAYLEIIVTLENN